ncbi:MAG TPA: potassium channel protein [Vicinamibacterales bacterium]|nr:potassium channel protein [Vicinamibacterales bacterium]
MRTRLNGAQRASGLAVVGPGGWLGGVRLAVLLLITVIAGGTAGYAAIEGWSAWDAFYMTVMTVTTVGYREVHPLSRAGQVFTTAVMVTGVGTLFYTASLIMTFLVEGELHQRFQRRRLERMMDDLTGHFIVCGYGRMGTVIAAEFRRQQVPFVIVERDAERVQAALEAGYIAVEADASSEEVLGRVGIGRARGLIAAVRTDAENVYTVLSARLLKPDLYIVSRAETDDARRKLLRAGADRVISPYQIGAQLLAQTALRPAVVDFVQLATSSENLELNIEQVRIEPGSALADSSIVDSNVRQRFGAVVVAIQRAEGSMEFNPAPDTVVHAGDHLVVLGRASMLRELESACAGR